MSDADPRESGLACGPRSERKAKRPEGMHCVAPHLVRRLDMSGEGFAADARWVMCDLHVAKRILEG